MLASQLYSIVCFISVSLNLFDRSHAAVLFKILPHFYSMHITNIKKTTQFSSSIENVEKKNNLRLFFYWKKMTMKQVEQTLAMFRKSCSEKVGVDLGNRLL